jgi:hypothetical protein
MHPKLCSTVVSGDRAKTETVNGDRLDELAARVREESFTVAELCAVLGDVPRAVLEELRASGCLLAVQPGKRAPVVYPRWQLRDGELRAELPQLIAAAADADLSELALHLRLVSGDGLDPALPLVASLDDRLHDVVAVIRASGSHGG